MKKKGEKYFRETETKTLKSLKTDSGNFVLSLGGGTIENLENISVLKDTGKIFYIDVPCDVILNRIKNDKTRPLLQTDDPKKALYDIYLRRKDKYELSDFKIYGEKNPQVIANEIKEAYEKING